MFSSRNFLDGSRFSRSFPTIIGVFVFSNNCLIRNFFAEINDDFLKRTSSKSSFVKVLPLHIYYKKNHCALRFLKNLRKGDELELPPLIKIFLIWRSSSPINSKKKAESAEEFEKYEEEKIKEVEKPTNSYQPNYES